MREKDGYREALEQLNNSFPTKEMLTLKEVAKYLGVCDKTIQNDKRFMCEFIQIGRSKLLSKTKLAKLIS